MLVSPPHPRRAIGVALSALLLASQLAGLAHHAQVAHRRCEHGEWVEAGHRGPPSSPLAERAAVAAATGAAREGGHEHCSLLFATPASAPVALPVLAEPRPAPATLPIALPAPPAQFSLLRFAPKTSPPA